MGGRLKVAWASTQIYITCFVSRNNILLRRYGIGDLNHVVLIIKKLQRKERKKLRKWGEVEGEKYLRLINQYGFSSFLFKLFMSYTTEAHNWIMDGNGKKGKKRQITLIHCAAVGSKLDMNGHHNLPAFRRSPIFKAESFVAGRICKRKKERS